MCIVIGWPAYCFLLAVCIFVGWLRVMILVGCVYLCCLTVCSLVVWPAYLSFLAV